MEREWKPTVEISPACPRCGSSNTKFCYYNNYSLTQPRYFCKGCRRYWTKGGSLRNVPVGGGCHRSRRGKSIRISTGRVPSRSLAYGGASAPPPGHINGNPLVESASSSIGPDGPNIDLALVYANFLNQKPELPSEVDPSIEFANMNMDFTTHHFTVVENGIVECPTLSERSSETHVSDSNAMYLCGFDSILKQQEAIQQFTTSIHTSNNNGLPPLPGEEVASQEMAWSNPPMAFANDLLHATQPSRIEPEAQQLIVDRSPFDLSSYGTIFRA